jgi:diketogulonate reductase-like aldo/keto reductase
MPSSIDRKPIGSDTISAIGLGSYGIKNYSKAFEAYVYGLTNGIDHVDTAEMYDMGKAEEFIGEVLKHVGRDGVFITTKMLPNRLEDKERIIKTAQESLRRMGINYVDLYLIHWPNERLKEAVYATKKAPIVALQVHYSVLNRKEVEEQLLPYCVSNKITLQAYTPIERGSVKDNPCVKVVSERTGKTPIQVSLNYLISHENVVAIPKAERVEHVKELIGAMGWRIPEAHMNYLKKCLE